MPLVKHKALGGRDDWILFVRPAVFCRQYSLQIEICVSLVLWSEYDMRTESVDDHIFEHLRFPRPSTTRISSAVESSDI